MSYSHTLDKYDARISGRESDVERFIERVERLEEVADLAENVVAQWRGDISRKPHIGRLREAIAALRSTSPKPEKP